MATAPESNLALTLPALHSSPSSSSSNYEVFLSFRGPDTRKTFTDHLYTALNDKGIRTFRDEEELGVGKPIKPNLLKSIQESRISIPIISPDYASSKSCLEELAKIMECKRKIGQIVIPIFYNVDVGDVKNQTGSFAEPFCRHEKQFHKNTVDEWKDALKDVGKLKGYDSKNVENGSKLDGSLRFFHLGSTNLLGVQSFHQFTKRVQINDLTVSKSRDGQMVEKRWSSMYGGRCLPKIGFERTIFG